MTLKKHNDDTNKWSLISVSPSLFFSVIMIVFQYHCHSFSLIDTQRPVQDWWFSLDLVGFCDRLPHWIPMHKFWTNSCKQRKFYSSNVFRWQYKHNSTLIINQIHQYCDWCQYCSTHEPNIIYPIYQCPNPHINNTIIWSHMPHVSQQRYCKNGQCHVFITHNPLRPTTMKFNW